MKTLTEIESMCQRILGVLEHDDLRSGNMVALTNMLTRLRDDLNQYLAQSRADGSHSPELHAAEDALGTMTNDVLWLREYAAVKPVLEASQKLRMAALRALRVVTLLQDETAVTGFSAHSPGRSRRAAVGHVTTRA